ncbi:MAG: 3-hydroxybutyryl-CoA dehydrogenase [bacterium TMED88]|nr:3-hydroxybutyryl-CoA dehydrogenase [Deltaproteobacteria bacterium]OUV24699.1 MAG: 3-hydroxybutyryl-CoA dehydrogenase [bacterium TMED88]
MSEIKTVGVVGAGVMGGGIAQSLAKAGYEVTCTDIASKALGAARQDAAEGRFGLAGAVARGKLDAAEAEAARARITWSNSFEEAAQSDLVIECVPEKLDVKLSVFRSLDEIAPKQSILASNTSGFSIAAMAGATRRPSRVIGWHWASPAFVMKFAEIVVTDVTSDAVREQVIACAEKCGKNPVVVRDNPLEWGFVANRIYFAMIREASRVVDEGVATRAEVNDLMVDCFRWPVGPFAMVKGAGSGWK